MSSLPLENTPPARSRDLSSGPLAVAKFLIGTFSTVRQRPPPSPSKTKHIRLITIKASHFCEKARWVLDLVEADPKSPYYFTEDAHPAPFQAYETLKATNEKASVTPMIIFEDEQEAETVLYDSTEIIKHFMPDLYPEEIRNEVEAMEADLGRRLGAGLRCVAYYHFLSDIERYHGAFVQLTADPMMVAKIESVVVDKFLDKGLGDGIKKALGITEETAMASAKAMREIFVELSDRLEESGGEYLMDTKAKSFGFTAADLTLSALAYPFLNPTQMKSWLKDFESFPSEIKILAEELRGTRAGQHVLKMYHRHRLPKGQTVVSMKYTDRNKSALEGVNWWPAASVGGFALVGIGVTVILGARSGKSTARY